MTGRFVQDFTSSLHLHAVCWGPDSWRRQKIGICQLRCKSVFVHLLQDRTIQPGKALVVVIKHFERIWDLWKLRCIIQLFGLSMGWIECKRWSDSFQQLYRWQLKMYFKIINLQKRTKTTICLYPLVDQWSLDDAGTLFPLSSHKIKNQKSRSADFAGDFMYQQSEIKRPGNS